MTAIQGISAKGAATQPGEALLAPSLGRPGGARARALQAEARVWGEGRFPAGEAEEERGMNRARALGATLSACLSWRPGECRRRCSGYSGGRPGHTGRERRLPAPSGTTFRPQPRGQPRGSQRLEQRHSTRGATLTGHQGRQRARGVDGPPAPWAEPRSLASARRKGTPASELFVSQTCTESCFCPRAPLFVIP